MKIKALALAVVAVAVSSSAYSTPMYVGANLSPKNNINLGFGYTPTKKTLTGGTETGTITNYALRGNYSVMENLTANIDLPFYWVSKNASAAGKSRFGMGNFALGANWNQRMSESSDEMAWGYSVSLDAALPLARKDEASVVSAANPTTDLGRYLARTTTITPMLGAWLENEMFMAKINLGVHYHNIGRKSVSVGATTVKVPSDRNRFNIPSQLGLSYKATANFALNAEYNGVFLDKASKEGLETGGKKTAFRQVITPSISGEFDGIAAQVYGNIPVDAATRKASSFSAGLNVGYMF
jgi:hypothetical protein